MERHASCACSQLTVTCSGDPDLVSVCHCRACQRRTGSAFGIAAFFPQSAVASQGEHKTWSRLTEAGHQVAFHFCPNCGSTVFWEAERKPGFIAMGVGAFGDSDFPGPMQEVHTTSRFHWIKPLDSGES
jgi:hypothetical protein